MRSFSPEFNAHIASQQTTLCWCWLITKTDGERLGFTDHDQSLLVDGVACGANSAVTAAELDQREGFAIDQSEISAGLTSAAITKFDLDAGLYDGAEISLYRVNWRESTVNAKIWSGRIGRIVRREDAVQFELVGQAEQLQRSIGRVFSRSCDAQFGDGRCGIDIAQWPAGTTCPKSFAACRDQFDNAVNFRGFPYLIGDDALQTGPETASKRDGSSRYNL